MGICITYLVFGTPVANYTQARFSLLTFLPQLENDDRILILTDHPQHFSGLGSRVELLSLSSAQLQDWKGPHQFFWRIKIKALGHIRERYPKHHLLYLDADTFLFGSLDALRHMLSSGNLMHLNEGLLSELPTKTERTMWAQVKGRTFAQREITFEDAMWNAGVVGISNRDHQGLHHALELCDAMCEAQIIPRLIEQFALSLALHSPDPLQPADHHIGHYWGNKGQWLQAINSLFQSHESEGLTLEELAAKASAFPFDSLPIYLKTSNSKVPFVRWLKAQLTAPKTEFIRKD